MPGHPEFVYDDDAKSLDCGAWGSTPRVTSLTRLRWTDGLPRCAANRIRVSRGQNSALLGRALQHLQRARKLAVAVRRRDLAVPRGPS